MSMPKRIPAIVLFPLSLFMLYLFATQCMIGCAWLSRHVCPSPEAHDRDYAILLKSRVFVPEPGLEARLERYFVGLAPVDTIHIMIQFYEVPDLWERQVLRDDLGVRLLDPIPERTFFASTPADPVIAEKLLRGEHQVRWIGAITPQDKVAPWLLDTGIPVHAPIPRYISKAKTHGIRGEKTGKTGPKP